MKSLIVGLLLSLQKFFQSTALADTSLVIEWTNQHGCGGNEDDDPHKLNCNIVIQYMVMDATEDGKLFRQV